MTGGCGQDGRKQGGGEKGCGGRKNGRTLNQKSVKIERGGESSVALVGAGGEKKKKRAAGYTSQKRKFKQEGPLGSGGGGRVGNKNWQFQSTRGHGGKLGIDG